MVGVTAFFSRAFPKRQLTPSPGGVRGGGGLGAIECQTDCRLAGHLTRSQFWETPRVVPLEAHRGVWVVRITLDAARRAGRGWEAPAAATLGGYSGPKGG